MEARTTCFISCIQLSFSVLTKRKTIQEARTINSHDSESVNHIFTSFSCNENTLVDHSKPTYYPSYFIKENATDNANYTMKNLN